MLATKPAETLAEPFPHPFSSQERERNEAFLWCFEAKEGGSTLPRVRLPP